MEQSPYRRASHRSRLGRSERTCLQPSLLSHPRHASRDLSVPVLSVPGRSSRACFGVPPTLACQSSSCRHRWRAPSRVSQDRHRRWPRTCRRLDRSPATIAAINAKTVATAELTLARVPSPGSSPDQKKKIASESPPIATRATSTGLIRANRFAHPVRADRMVTCPPAHARRAPATMTIQAA